jgi:hypothetical protein
MGLEYCDDGIALYQLPEPEDSRELGRRGLAPRIVHAIGGVACGVGPSGIEHRGHTPD